MAGPDSSQNRPAPDDACPLCSEPRDQHVPGPPDPPGPDAACLLRDPVRRVPHDCEHGYRAAGGSFDCPVCEEPVRHFWMYADPPDRLILWRGNGGVDWEREYVPADQLRDAERNAGEAGFVMEGRWTMAKTLIERLHHATLIDVGGYVVFADGERKPAAVVFADLLAAVVDLARQQPAVPCDDAAQARAVVALQYLFAAKGEKATMNDIAETVFRAAGDNDG